MAEANFDLGFDPLAEETDEENNQEAAEQQIEQDEKVDEQREELRRFINGKRNVETVRKTSRDIRKFYAWLQANGEKRKIEDLPPYTLDVNIGQYILQLKKADGTNYEPSSLTAVFGSIKRYLEDNAYQLDLATSHEFSTCRKVIAAKKKELKSLGLGNQPNKADPITDDEEERLWECGALGSDTPKNLRATMWYLTTKFCGFRGRQEARQMSVGDLEIKRDSENKEYIEFNERQTKTRQGDQNNVRAFKPKMWSNSQKPERCPVYLLKKFLSHRPEDTKKPESPFLLSINYKRAPNSIIWYTRQPMGVNEISKLMPEMAKQANLSGHKTNHSVRKMTCTKLLHQGIPPTIVAQLSGHKNVNSLNNYSTASMAQQKHMFYVLSNQAERSWRSHPLLADYNRENMPNYPAITQGKNEDIEEKSKEQSVVRYEVVKKSQNGSQYQRDVTYVERVTTASHTATSSDSTCQDLYPSTQPYDFEEEIEEHRLSTNQPKKETTPPVAPPPYNPRYGAADAAPPNPPAYDNIGSPTEPPPSYESLFGQVRTAKETSSSVLDFVKKILIIVAGTLGCTICVGIVLAVPISMIVMGTLYRSSCHIEPYIPIYLIVGGVFGVLKNFSIMCQRVKSHYDENEERMTKMNPFDSLLSCFLTVWFIAGNIWIYRIFGQFNDKDPDSENYCNPVLYYYAFWITTASYILIGAVCLCICSAGFVAAVCGKDQ